MQVSNSIIQFKTIEYNKKDNEIKILDQKQLPEKEIYVTLKNIEDVYQAIKNMNVRGAPLIGVTAAYGVVMSAAGGNPEAVLKTADYLKSARPTAINLAWAVERMMKKSKDAKNLYGRLLEEASHIELEDKESCLRMGEIGAELIEDGANIMVHCNAGALATSGIGTALGVLYTAKKRGKKFSVYSCERQRKEGKNSAYIRVKRDLFCRGHDSHHGNSQEMRLTLIPYVIIWQQPIWRK